VFDFIGLLCLRSRGIFAVYFWANLCFSTLIGFFTPKIGTTPIWLFFMVTIGALAIKGIASSNVQRVRT